MTKRNNEFDEQHFTPCGTSHRKNDLQCRENVAARKYDLMEEMSDENQKSSYPKEDGSLTLRTKFNEINDIHAITTSRGTLMTHESSAQNVRDRKGCTIQKSVRAKSKSFINVFWR